MHEWSTCTQAALTSNAPVAAGRPLPLLGVAERGGAAVRHLLAVVGGAANPWGGGHDTDWHGVDPSAQHQQYAAHTAVDDAITGMWVEEGVYDESRWGPKTGKDKAATVTTG